jgi:hypothetical protein
VAEWSWVCFVAHPQFSQALDAAATIPSVRRRSASWTNYALSLPERLVRSASALAGGLLNEVGEAALPASVRRTRLYRALVEAALRFLIEQVGRVEGVFPSEGKLAEDFLFRRAAGNGIELVGILTFRASPVWVFAVLADLSGVGAHLLHEITESLKREGLLSQTSSPTSVEEILDGLEEAAGRTAEAINTPPLDVASLRREWMALQTRWRSLPTHRLIPVESLEHGWRDLTETAHAQNRSVFEISSLVALSAVTRLPRGLVWMSRSARVAAKRAGEVFGASILDHYTETLARLRREGALAWWAREFRPYLAAAARQFSPRQETLTEDLLGRGQ